MDKYKNMQVITLSGLGAVTYAALKKKYEEFQKGDVLQKTKIALELKISIPAYIKQECPNAKFDATQLVALMDSGNDFDTVLTTAMATAGCVPVLDDGSGDDEIKVNPNGDNTPVVVANVCDGTSGFAKFKCKFNNSTAVKVGTIAGVIGTGYFVYKKFIA